jgi:hypothetical protein
MRKKATLRNYNYHGKGASWAAGQPESLAQFSDDQARLHSRSRRRQRGNGNAVAPMISLGSKSPGKARVRALQGHTATLADRLDGD